MKEYNNLPEGLFMTLLVLVVMAAIGGIILYCAYLKNLQELLKAIRPANRLMQPVQVWLLAILFLNLLLAAPVIMLAWQDEVNMNIVLSVASVVRGIHHIATLFILFWQYWVVQKISGSVELEYHSRNIAVESRPTYQAGLAYVICLAAGFLLDFLSIRFLNLIVSVTSLVFWIMYWIKTARYKKALKAMPPNPDEESPLFRDLY